MTTSLSEAEKERICGLVRKNLRDFPLYDEEHGVLVAPTSGGNIAIAYRTVNNLNGMSRIFETTRFDLSIEEDICYVLLNSIAPDKRGKGNGGSLYSTIEGIARDVGCSHVRISPSGQTPNGKTRREYLHGRGYVDIVDGWVEKVL